MATNPMQRKSRISFFLGMLLMLVIAAAVVALLYMKIQNQQKQIDEYVSSATSVYVLNQDVKSGQALTMDMFSQVTVPITAVPSNATSNVATTLSSYSLSDNAGRSIYYNRGGSNAEDTAYYYERIGDKAYKVYKEGENAPATVLSAGVSAYIKADDSNERTTNDLRNMEYNVISLPVDLNPDEYIDVRLSLPNGWDYIVLSKKKVTIPMSNGSYLADTVQMNLTEEEILMMSEAIVENYQTSGAKLYASRYTEAGAQSAATATYYPSNDVIEAIRDCKKVCKLIHLPLQSGSTEVLRKMNRNYSKEQYLELAQKIRKMIPEATFTTDIIVGFPEETERDFEDTLDVVQKVKFEQVFMFIYSRRVGTKADRMENQIPEEIKHERFDRLKELVEKQIAERNKEYIGTVQKVLIEGTSKNNDKMLTGRTDSNRVVVLDGDKSLIGKMAEIEIEEEHMWYLKGKIKE